MQTLHEKIKKEIDLGHIEKAKEMVEEGLTNNENDAMLYYLKGCILMKEGKRKEATNSFLHSEKIDPNSPAVEVRKMLTDIMNFYHKDLYNP